MAYDQYGNMTSQINPDGNTWYFTYDEAGNMLTRTDPLGMLSPMNTTFPAI